MCIAMCMCMEYNLIPVRALACSLRAENAEFSGEPVFLEVEVR